ncbi:MAG: hypothetical protein IJ097_01980 [Bacilli bacterium]|nr:hypothetical protein [Bacilli bacterium]
MGINFNIVKKPKHDENENIEEQEEELEEEDLDVDVKSNNYDPKRKMFRFMGIIVGIMILILLILFIMSLGNNKKSYSYSQIERIMEKAAKSYFKDNASYLPEEDSIIEVDVSTLVEAGKMKDLSEYTKKGVSCVGSVSVQNEDSSYIYTPNLDCGNDYSTIPLYEKVLNNNETVSSGYGLYSNNGDYVFRGENVDNYVQLNNNLWRIVKITSDNNIVLISATGVGYTNTWDNRYNENMKYESGINNYSSSRAKEFLEKIYKNPIEKEGEDILSKKDKSKLVEFDVCVGKRNGEEESKDNSIECREKVRDQKLGLLTLSDFLYASVDPNCKSASTKSCKNYNYLVIKANWWLATASTNDTSLVFKVAGNGIVRAERASTYASIRPVIYLNDSVMFKSGKGTLEKPYKVR